MHRFAVRFVASMGSLGLLLLVLMTTTPTAWAGGHQGVFMQIRANFVESDQGCDLLGLVASPTPAEPTTLCAVGGPFGNGVVGIVTGGVPVFTGAVIHLDRIVTVNDTDSFSLRALFNFQTLAVMDPGGVNLFTGTWEITGGTGAFAGMRGKGSLVNAILSVDNIPPPPQFAVEQYQGEVW